MHEQPQAAPTRPRLYADGHAEIRKWLDARTKAPAKYNNWLTLGVESPNNRNMIWLSEHTSALDR